MDEEFARLVHDTDAEFRAAAYWWMRLRECGSDRRTLLGFEHWVTASAAHRRAFARVEALWETMRRASPERPAATVAETPHTRSREAGT